LSFGRVFYLYLIYVPYCRRIFYESKVLFDIVPLRAQMGGGFFVLFIIIKDNKIVENSLIDFDFTDADRNCVYGH